MKLTTFSFQLTEYYKEKILGTNIENSIEKILSKVSDTNNVRYKIVIVITKDPSFKIIFPKKTILENKF